MVGNWFLRLGVLFSLAGLALGTYMGMQHDFKLAAVHTHITTIGWIGMFLAGLFYNTISPTSEYIETIGSQMPKSAGLHLIVAFVGALAMTTGNAALVLDWTYSGTIGGQVFDHFAWGEKAMMGGSIGVAVAQVLFAINVLRGTSR